MTFLMPDPAEAEFHGITEDWPAYRVWWSETVMGMKIPKRRTSGRFKPIPGVLDVTEEDAG